MELEEVHNMLISVQGIITGLSDQDLLVVIDASRKWFN